MTGNIIGEPFEGFVQEQIGVRQLAQFGGYDNLRNNAQLQYLNNRNAWVKLASSIKISDNIAGNKKLGKIGIESPTNYLGTRLAESAILFNTFSKYTPNGNQAEQSGGSLSSNRAGASDAITADINNRTIGTLWNDSFAYGIGARDFGLQPPPGITGVTVDSLNRGSIRKANVTLKAHNRFQFDIIELLYLRLGYTMMLEWGWDKYIEFINDSSDELIISSTGNTIIEDSWFDSNGVSQIGMINLIQDYREKYSGNYDGFFGKVSNFTWNFNPDGTYDISIDLITIGDVIESLKVNTSSKFLGLPTGTTPPEPTTEIPEEANNITKAAYINTVGYFLYLKAYEVSAGFNDKNLASRTTVSGSIINDGVNNYYVVNPAKTRPNINTTAKGNQSTQFYIRLKEFFAQLETLVIPQIDGDLQLQFELDSCYMSHFPNQISFDPKVCVFKFPLDYGDIPTSTTGDYEGVLNPALSGIDSNYLQYLANFTTKSGNYTYGDLMNIYVNFEFISGLLLSNGGPDQTITLFKFLQDLCNGINSALGGVNKLEPIIKNDYIVTIIDQTFSSASSRNVVSLEVFGYNTKLQTSNFVKDIKFVSKITPQLASMITIGATAAGSSTSEIDGTAFSKWGEGLVDRFSTEISSPTGLSTLESQQAAQQQQETENYYKGIWSAFPSSGNVTGARIQNKLGAVSRIIGAFFGGGGSVGGGVVTAVAAAPIITRQEQINSQKLDQIEKKIIGKPYQKFLNQSMTFQEFYPKALAYDAWLKDNKVYNPEEIQDQINSNYLLYLLNAFGGTTSEYKIPYPNNNSKTTLVANFKIPSQNARYLEFNDSFIAQGKAAYQNYLNTLNSNRFRDKNIPSNEVGFIPLSFEVLLDGISGIKIYNKLDINNSFLPSNYPESLKFIITKVNHNISNNSWDTSLSTISIPETSEYKSGEFTTPQKQIPAPQGGNNDSGNGDSSLPRVVDGVTQVSLTTGISLVNPSLSSKYPNKVIYVPQETTKTQIYLHHTAGQGTARAVIKGTWATSKFTYPIGTHYIIEASGQTEYVFDEKYWSHHLAKRKLERSSISVELMSYGTLKLKNGKYYAWPAKYSNTVIPADQVARPIGKDGKIINYRGFDYFQRYTDAQIKALETLFIQWKQKYPDINWTFNYDEMFPPTGVTSSIAESGASGVYSHCSVRTDKIDIFPQKELIDMLKRVLK